MNVMIVSVRERRVYQLMDGVAPKQFPPNPVRAARNRIRMLDAAVSLEELLIPTSNRLERLRGDRTGQWSIRINRQWRICFRWTRHGAEDVEIVDYH